MSDPVPAIAESAATGEIAEIFTDIRKVLGVEVVNLIWRHLATIPGALPWAWGMLRPLYADGSIRAEAQALHVRIALPPLPPFPRELLAAIGLGDDDLMSIRNILAAYDRTNAMALVALSALLCRLDRQHAESGEAVPGAPTPPAAPPRAIPLPALPGLDTLSEPTVHLVLTLNRLGTRRGTPVLASMYRHLAYWPSYLALSWALIAPLDGDGSLERAIADVLETARAQAVRLALRFRAPPLDRTTEGSVRAAIEPFAGDVIARMVVICALLHSATDQTPEEGRPA